MLDFCRTGPVLISRLAVLGFALLAAAGTAGAEPVHAIAMHGQPLHGPGFKHFDAVNPDAPKGGRLIQGIQGSFDSLNPLIIRGVAAAGIRDNVIESLLARGLDEPFSLYGLIAESLEVPADRSEVTFTLNPKARFSDGTPITAKDVLFSFNVLKERGRPNHRAYFKKVEKAEQLSERKVRFVFDGAGDRELPLILGLMPILASHTLTPETFEQTTLKPITGSGPYLISRVDAGRSIVYTRDPKYWGRDLSANRGRYNADEIRYEYYRDSAVMFEAFKAGEIDIRFEDDPALWAQGYDFPAVRDGRIIKAEFETRQPAGMTGLVFNTRRKVFASPEVRRALILLFDFEFANKSLFNDRYKRTQSYFERSFLASPGTAADDEEQRLLAAYPGAVRPDILDGTARMPASEGTGRNRANQQKALELLTAAGFKQTGGKLIDPSSGQPFDFELLVNSGSGQRLLSGFKADLAKLGITMRIRQVDTSQYQARLKTYDYDMIQTTWAASLSPGNEQLFRWSGAVGRQDGSFNFAGVDNPAADAMISAMLAATEPGAFVSAVRALDRVLLSGDYVIPLFHIPRQWVAHSKRVKYPARVPVAGVSIDAWWIEGP